MPLLHKVLLRLTLVALLLVIFYFYLMSNGDRYFVFNLRAQNANPENLTTTSATASGYSTKANYSSSTARLCNQTGYYNVWCIFTKVALNSPMRHKFQIFLDSLLRLTSVDVAFHVISDDDSQRIAQTIIQDVMTNTEKFMEVRSLFYILFYSIYICLS